MNWEDIFKITTGIFISIGSSGLIIFGLSNWLGKVWANRILEKEKNELSIIKASALRYSGKQFELYNELWHSSCDLKSKADDLWEKANDENFSKFSLQLKNTIEKIKKSYLFIEDEHYSELSTILDKLKHYALGKEKLILIYMLKNSTTNVTNEKIEQIIDENRDNIKRVSILIDGVGKSLKEKIQE